MTYEATVQTRIHGNYLVSVRKSKEARGSNFILKDTNLCVTYKKPYDFIAKSQGRLDWRVVVDGRRTLQPLEISLLIKLYRKRSMGALISLGDPLDTTLPYNKGILSQHRQKSSEIPASTT